MSTSTARRPKTLLLVEDNDDDAFLFARILKRVAPDWELFAVEDGEAGLRYLDASTHDEECLPSAIFIDLHLPRVNGLEVIASIRSRPGMAGVRCFAVSAVADDATRLRAMKAGAHNVFLKPLSDATLALALAEG